MPGFLMGPLTGFVDRMKGKGLSPASFLTQFGGGAAMAAGGGNLAVFASQVGVGNGADTTEDTLFTGSLPSNSLNIVGRELSIQAWGNITATSATKNARVYFGTTVIANIAYTLAQTGAWLVIATIVKTAANQQAVVVSSDTVVSGTLTRSVATFSPAEIDTAAIILRVTGQSSVATANTVTCNGFIPAGYN